MSSNNPSNWPYEGNQQSQGYGSGAEDATRVFPGYNSQPHTTNQQPQQGYGIESNGPNPPYNSQPNSPYNDQPVAGQQSYGYGSGQGANQPYGAGTPSSFENQGYLGNQEGAGYPNNNQPAYGQQSSYGQPQSPYNQQAYNQPQPLYGQPSSGKSNNALIFSLIGGGLLLVLVLVVGGVWLLNQSNNSSDTASGESSSASSSSAPEKKNSAVGSWDGTLKKKDASKNAKFEFNDDGDCELKFNENSYNTKCTWTEENNTVHINFKNSSQQKGTGKFQDDGSLVINVPESGGDVTITVKKSMT